MINQPYDLKTAIGKAGEVMQSMESTYVEATGEATFPLWPRLVRKGDAFAAYTAPDAGDWPRERAQLGDVQDVKLRATACVATRGAAGAGGPPAEQRAGVPAARLNRARQDVRHRGLAGPRDAVGNVVICGSATDGWPPNTLGAAGGRLVRARVGQGPGGGATLLDRRELVFEHCPYEAEALPFEPNRPVEMLPLADASGGKLHKLISEQVGEQGGHVTYTLHLPVARDDYVTVRYLETSGGFLYLGCAQASVDGKPVGPAFDPEGPTTQMMAAPIGVVTL